MKYLFLAVAIFFSNWTIAQLKTNIYWTQQTNLPKSEVIYYDLQSPLVWNDFKGTANGSSIAAAITVSGFGYKAGMKKSGEEGQLDIGVYCYFNKNTSWVKPGKTTGYILSHEQQHFNISYIAACYFVEKLKTASVTNSNYSSLLPALYKESCDLMNKMQNDYDGQTKNGQLKDIQAKWDEYVSKRITASIASTK